MSLRCHCGARSGCRWGLIMHDGARLRDARVMAVLDVVCCAMREDDEDLIVRRMDEYSRKEIEKMGQMERLDCHCIGVSGGGPVVLGIC